MADFKQDPTKKDPKVIKQKETVEVTIEMLRQEIMGMKTKLTRRSSCTTITENLASMNQKMEESNKMEECEKRVNEAKKRHRRETEKRANEYDSTIRYLQEQIVEEGRRSDELRGRLEECRTAKNMAITELSDLRDDYGQQIKELKACISDGEMELGLLKSERQKYREANLKLKQLEEGMEKSGEELEELRRRAEDLTSELELKNKVVEQLEGVKTELEVCKEKLETDFNAVKEKLEKYVEQMKENSNQESICKVLEDQLDQMKQEVTDLKTQVDLEKTRSGSLEGEVADLQEKGKERESLYIRKIADLNCEVSKLLASNEELLKKIQEIQYFEEKLKETTATFEAQVKDLEAQLQSKVEELQGASSAQEGLKTEIQELGKETTDLKQQIEDFKGVLASCERVTKEKTETLNEQTELIQAKDREIDVLKGNVRILKQTTMILDEQLVAFETVLNKKVEEVEEAKKMHELLDGENKEIREQLRKSRIEVNEARSKTAYTEVCMKNTESTLKSIAETKDSEVLSVLQKLEVAEKHNEELLGEITKLTTQLTELEGEKFEFKKELETSNAERDRNTRDLHALLKTVVDVKEVNYQLSSELEQALEEVRACRDELEEQDGKLAEIAKSLNIKEVMYNTRTTQQNKLIQHLTDQLTFYQEKYDKKKKKPLFFSKEAVSPKTPGPYFPQRKYAAPPFVGATPSKAYVYEEELEEIREVLKSPLKTLNMNTSPTVNRIQTLPSLKEEDYGVEEGASNTLAAGPVKPPRLADSRPEANVRAFGLQEKTAFDSPSCTTTCSNMPLNEEQTDYTEGWANVLTGKMTAPEQRYVKIEGTFLHVYVSENTLYKPVESFELDEYTTVYFRIDTEEEAVLKPLKRKFKFAMKVVFHSSQEEASSYIFMFLDNKIQKRFWTRAINKYSKMRFLAGDLTLYSDLSLTGDEDKENPAAVNLLQRSLLECVGKDALYVNCFTVFPNSRLFLFGCEEGLYSVKGVGGNPVKIQGPSSVHHIEILEGARLVVFIEGDGRVLATADLRTFKSCATAAECSQPQLVMATVPMTKGCYNLSARCTSVDDLVVVAGSGSRMLICKMDGDGKGLAVFRDLNIKEGLTSLLITPFSVIYGNYDVFEIDTQDFSIEEFLDTSFDSINLLKNMFENYGNYPVAILDVTESNGSDASDPEYLFCFPDMGIFVDSFGRPTRPGELLWTQVPLFVEYRHPFLYIFHPSNIEVQKLDKNSYQTYTVNSKKGKKHEMVEQRTHYPVSRFYPVELKSRSVPQFIGKGLEGVVFVFNEEGSTKVLELTAS